ncbi:BTB/POZ domain-containing protein 2, partial [Aphelenchoides avenae]
FMCLDEVSIGYRNLVSAVYLAKKYLLPSFMEQCIKFLKTRVDARCVADYLYAADTIEELGAVCWKLVDDVTDDLLVRYTDGDGDNEYLNRSFTSLPSDLVFAITKREHLTVNERYLYKCVGTHSSCVVEWATEQPESEEEERSDGIQGDKLREVLGDIVYNIRFPTMTEKEFYSGPAVSGFLTPDEVASILKWFENKTVPEKFNVNPRSPQLHGETNNVPNLIFIRCEVCGYVHGGKRNYGNWVICANCGAQAVTRSNCSCGKLVSVPFEQTPITAS